MPLSAEDNATPASAVFQHLTRALSKLNAEARQAVFERARVILVEQLRTRKPPATEPEIMGERFALEDAIAKVELNLAKSQAGPARIGGEHPQERYGS